MVRTLDVEVFQRQKEFFTKKVLELGGEPIVVSANNDDQLQIKQSEELMNQGVKALVVFPVNMYTSAAIVRSAHNKGVKIVSYDRLIMNCDLDFYVSHNNEMAGELSASLMVSKVPSGNYMLLCGDKMDRNARLVYNGYMKVLKNYSDKNQIKVSYEIFIESWDKKEAFHEFKNYHLLSASVPDAVLCSSDAFVSPIIEYLEKEHINEKVRIAGMNAFLQSCRYVIQGKQEFTIYKSYRDLIDNSVIVAFQLINNQVPKVELSTNNGRTNVPTILLPVYAVDKSNMEEVIVGDGYFTKEQVFN